MNGPLTVGAGSEAEPKLLPPTSLVRVWRFLTRLEEQDLEVQWGSFLRWPPDVFALSASILRRSGAYTSALASPEVRGKLLPFDKDSKLELQGACQWRTALEKALHAPGGAGILESEAPDIAKIWRRIWECKEVYLHKVATNINLMAALVDAAALADEVSCGIGLPFRASLRHPLSHPLICEGWRQLEPGRFGSTLCGRLIDPRSARVLPKLHTPSSGLTMRSFSHHLALSEADEVQPRWFMVPSASGEAENQNHVNLLVVPWPEECKPTQFRRSVHKEPVRGQGEPSLYFSFNLENLGSSIADRIDALCKESERLLGRIDGVVLPELALTQDDYQTVRMRVLRRGLMLVTGVGVSASDTRPGENYLCVDVPLSCHHAIHFRQGKHHQWRLDGNQIRTYGIGAQLHPDNAYWEDIAVADRRLLFLVLRPWLVTSVLICEDLARHDPIGELIRNVGPHLVIALLMDGPQLSNRWSSRYAAALADDPGSSVLSISSLGMVTLSRWDAKTKPSRIVALWKDARYGFAKELELPEGAAGLALTISVEYGKEVSADGRSDEHSAAYPTLTAFHAINLRADYAGSHATCAADPNEQARDAEHRFLSPHEAAALARLVQQEIGENPAPTVLSELTGEALGIAKEIWKIITNDNPTEEQAKRWRENPGDYADLPTRQQTETARQIVEWMKSFKQATHPDTASGGSMPADGPD